jgi:N-acetylmuramoyl-L-alanine amidase
MVAHKTRGATDFIVIHCAQTTPEMDTRAADIRRWHVQENGWADIGYHLVIGRDGKLEAGRPLHTIGAHVAGYNNRSVGICLAGGCDEQKREQNNFTPEQWATLRTVVLLLKMLWPEAVVQGHRDFPNVAKYCPSFDVKPWWAEIEKGQ